MNLNPNRDPSVDISIHVMGPELGEVFGLIRKEYWELHREVSYYRHLYMSGDNVGKLLNESAPDFFGLVQSPLHDGVVLRIARLSDPSVQGGYTNISVDQLIEEAKHFACSDDQQKADLDRLGNEFKNSAEPMRVWRMKVIAHHDLTTAQDAYPDPINDRQIKNVLSAFRALLSFVGSLFYFADPPDYTGADAKSLIRYLRAAQPELERQRKIEDEMIGF